MSSLFQAVNGEINQVEGIFNGNRFDTKTSESSPGMLTPQSDLGPSLQPFILKYKKLEYIFSVPTSLLATTTRWRDAFLDSLVDLTAQNAAFNEATSVMELVSQFLGFITRELEDDLDWSLDREVLRLAINQFEHSFLHNNEIHAVVASLTDCMNRPGIVQSYYGALKAIKRPMLSPGSALMRAVSEGGASVYLAFGGQGNTETYLDEMRDIYTTYPSLTNRFFEVTANLLQRLSQNSRASKFFPHGLDIIQWLNEPNSQPDIDYLISAPVSFPLIGLTQLAHYLVTNRVLGTNPGNFRNHLSGTTGHSQGIVSAAAIAAARDWQSFEGQTLNALTILFWIGVRSQEAYPLPSLAPSVLDDSKEHGEGRPTPALSIRGLPRVTVEKYMQTTNQYLRKDEQIAISLVNGAENFVIMGPPMALYGLNLRLRATKAPIDDDQTRIPYSQRKPHFINQFLPISAPFHSPYLSEAVEALQEDLREIEISVKELDIPVYNTFDGKDIRSEMDGNTNIVPSLVKMICQDPVIWEKAVAMPKATHILDFGPGNVGLTSRIKEGTGVRIILANNISNGTSNTEVGFKHEIFARNAEDVKYATNWAKEYGPKLLRRKLDGQKLVETKLSTLLGLPPIIVAGMTPCTVPWDFVAATTNAGYEIELGGGGYFKADDLVNAISKISRAIPPGRGIVINLIYAAPKAIAWQIPLIRSLCSQGVPIKGLTIGAGVPSLEVANEYIQTLGIRQITFKPGSAKGIQQVIDIAKENSSFPVILQWTGGRGGGHHSYEDFHEPILSMYGKIRGCGNIFLVAGSGFGGSDDSYPYLSGLWSLRYNRPLMPFDGVLFASRCMVAKEAHTSKAAKQAIVDTVGLDNQDWERTYRGPGGGGGIVTVRSEMGEPIHKLATRGVIFWAEMDKRIFSLSKDKRLVELEKKEVRDYIIRRLNDDFQKPWFGRNASGEAVELHEMTYGEIVSRMVELMFIPKQTRWIDKSLARLTGDFIRYIEQRFANGLIRNGGSSLIQTYSELDEPSSVVRRVFESYPAVNTQLINTRDRLYFLRLCKRSGQKPVPFIPSLDEEFEYWFKKDSLWQSEDLDAVVDQDVGRVCILHGPVAAKYSTVVDEPIKDVLDGVHSGYIKRLTQTVYGGDETEIPSAEYFGDNTANEIKAAWEIPKNIRVSEIDNKVSYHISPDPESSLPDRSEWIKLLAGKHASWRRAFLTTEIFVQEQGFQKNPTHQLLAPAHGMFIEISDPDSPKKTVITVKEVDHEESKTTISIGPMSESVIPLNLIEYRTASGKPVALPLLFTYHPEAGYAPIHERMTHRNKRIREFYHKVWFGAQPVASFDMPTTSRFDGGMEIVTGAAIRELTGVLGNANEAYIDRRGGDCLAPMDFAIVVGWKALIRPLIHSVDCDLLKLVHLSNRFRMMPGAKLFRKGDIVNTASEITAIVNQSSGKMVEVCATIAGDDGKPLMQVTSQFFYRGTYTDYKNTFQRKDEGSFKVKLKTPKEVAILKSKEWFVLEEEDVELLESSVVFKIQTSTRFRDQATFSSVRTGGIVELELPSKEIVQVASVDYVAGHSLGNPVLDYLNRTGTKLSQPIIFEHPVPLQRGSARTPLIIKAPASNGNYARVSGDYNPVHVSRIFAEYVQLPGTITHGMFTSGAIRTLIEWATEDDGSHMRDYNVSFVGMVLPGDKIQVQLHHTGMIDGCKIISIEAVNANTEEKVLTGEAIIEQPMSAYIFTGQGSQEQGMGMDLYERSPVAKEVWDRADKHFLNTFGFSILNIIQNNPKELTVHFGGAAGKAIRQNYMAMIYQSTDSAPDSNAIHTEKIFKDITDSTSSYTFRSPTGLLSATQFTQPAMTLLQIAVFEDLRSRGVIQPSSVFAGHSLGEYSALATIAQIMPIESLVSVVFYRGLCMQVAVERDEAGRSNYSMCAVNPSRISPDFSEDVLKHIVAAIVATTGLFLEIVNYNVRNWQYVCAGDLSALDVLAGVLDTIKSQNLPMHRLSPPTDTNTDTTTSLTAIITQSHTYTQSKPHPLTLTRSHATIPLSGIDVPFHSTYLRPNIPSFRSFLLKSLKQEQVDPEKLVGKYVPNVLGNKVFKLTKDFVESVWETTGSERVGEVLGRWDERSEKGV